MPDRCGFSVPPRCLVHSRTHCIGASESDSPHGRSLRAAMALSRTHTSVDHCIRFDRDTQQIFGPIRDRGRPIAHNIGTFGPALESLQPPTSPVERRQRRGRIRAFAPGAHDVGPESADSGPRVGACGGDGRYREPTADPVSMAMRGTTAQPRDGRSRCHRGRACRHHPWRERSCCPRRWSST